MQIKTHELKDSLHNRIYENGLTPFRNPNVFFSIRKTFNQTIMETILFEIKIKIYQKLNTESHD
jgi:hypothetical protein